MVVHINPFIYFYSKFLFRESEIGQQVIFIDEPEYLRGPFKESINKFVNWTDSFITEYQQSLRFGTHDGYCLKSTSGEYLVKPAEYPNCLKAHMPEDVCGNNKELSESATYPCKTDTGISTNPTYLMIFAFIPALFYAN